MLLTRLPTKKCAHLESLSFEIQHHDVLQSIQCFDLKKQLLVSLGCMWNYIIIAGYNPEIVQSDDEENDSDHDSVEIL